jgi:hypothetical protein
MTVVRRILVAKDGSSEGEDPPLTRSGSDGLSGKLIGLCIIDARSTTRAGPARGHYPVQDRLFRTDPGAPEDAVVPVSWV